MNSRFTIFLFFIGNIFVFAQNPGDAFNPMTAPGASGIHNYNHILFWENPDSVVFNRVYFNDDSLKVASLDSTAIIYDGYPSSVLDSAALNIWGWLNDCAKFYWRVVEQYGTGTSNGEVWWFSADNCTIGLFDDFEDGLSNWTITTQSGCPWDAIPIGTRPYWMPFQAEGNALASDADLCGSSGGGSSSTATVAISNISNVADNAYLEWDNDWFPLGSFDSAYIDISYDNGESWTNLVTFDGTEVRNTHENHFFPISTIGQSFIVRFKTVQPGWDWWWAIDNVKLTWNEPLTPSVPPSLLQARASYEEQKVILNWNSGYSPDPILGYRIQRKTGLPTDTSAYVPIAETGANDFTYTDLDVNLNEIYTYRIATKSGFRWLSNWGNEATAYVPPFIPVELVSFTASVSNNSVDLNWATSTETNNKGFNVERRQKLNDQPEWQIVGFIQGNGTTTRSNSYSFTDENLTSGKYQYRLKQVDYDGTYKYSNVVDVVVNLSEEFSLSQNFPNPFNPVTIIKYSIPSVGTSFMKFVQLKVYDVLGNEVATLVNQEKPAGIYSVEFDGSKLSSGVYFYKLNYGSFTATKKLIFLK